MRDMLRAMETDVCEEGVCAGGTSVVQFGAITGDSPDRERDVRKEGWHAGLVRRGSRANRIGV